MVYAWLFVVVLGSSASASIPQPRLRQLPNNRLEIAVEDVPGLKLKHVTYGIANEVHYGSFYQSVNGEWYHQKDEIDYKPHMDVYYSILGEIHGTPFQKEGTIKGQAGYQVALTPPGRIRRQGTIVMRDEFDGAIDTSLWEYEVSMYGGYNWEIQVYTNDPLNCFTRDGNLLLMPTLTSDKFGEEFLHSGTMDVEQEWGTCTNSDRYGCVRNGVDGLLPPIMSCKLKSIPTIRFGRACVSARIPKGDWIWPAIWMLPRDSEYGEWPQSGEIDIMESRGNAVAQDGAGNHGSNEVGSTLHWGSDTDNNRYDLTHGVRSDSDYDSSFHEYCLDWTIDHLIVTVDDKEVMRTDVGAGGFWEKGNFGGDNLWASGTKAAPFDEQFYFIMNVAIGGTNGFFPDEWTYGSTKPWANDSPHEDQDFWDARQDWLPTWQGDAVAMEVEWVQLEQY